MSARLTKTEYEREVVDKLRFYLVERGWDIRHRGNKIVVEDVRLDGPGAVRMVAIFFREETRTECLFGWRYPATEADSDAMDDRRAPRSLGGGTSGSRAGGGMGGHVRLDALSRTDRGVGPRAPVRVRSRRCDVGRRLLTAYFRERLPSTRFGE
jgi:hypothetical protein